MLLCMVSCSKPCTQAAHTGSVATSMAPKQNASDRQILRCRRCDSGQGVRRAGRQLHGVRLAASELAITASTITTR